MPAGLSRAPRRSRFTTILLAAVVAVMALPTAVVPQTVHAASAPTVTSLNPEAGPTTGGTTVDVYGSNFDSTAVVNFGTTAAASVSLLSSSELQVTTPQGIAEGQVPVTVTTTLGGISAVAAPATTFQFTNPGPTEPVSAITRICDTRVSGNGCSNNGPLSRNTAVNVQVTGNGGVPTSGVAAAVMDLHIFPTTAGSGSYGNVGVYPAGLASGGSELSWVNGNTESLLIEIPVSPQVNGSTGDVTIENSYTSQSAVNYAFDVEGYVPDTQSDASGLINAINPVQAPICDTETSSTTCYEPNNAGWAPGNTPNNVTVIGQGGVPATTSTYGVSAVILNVQTYAEAGSGYLVVGPAGVSYPWPTNGSEINFQTNTPTTNHMLVPVGTNGQISVYVSGAATQVSIAVDGWITDNSNPDPPSAASLYYPNNGSLICDTIANTNTPCSGGGQLGTGSLSHDPLSVQVTGEGGVPSTPATVSGVELSLTVTNVSGVSGGTDVCVYPSNGSCDEADLNLTGGVPANLLVIVPVGPDGKVDVYTPTGNMDVLIAVTGYYAADPPTLPTTWTQFAPTSSPSGRVGSAMTYDTARQDDVLFGGNSGLGLSTLLNDTWVWSGGEWAQESPATSPTPRQGAMMAYDPVTQTDILFGGTTAGGDVADTWSWNGTTWSQLSPATSPSARDSGFMAYDQALGEIVLFGGNSTLGSLTDTWTWNGTTWTQQTGGSSTPPNSTVGAMTYDEAQQKLIYIDGSNQQMWAWGPLPGVPAGGWVSEGTTPLSLGTADIAWAYDPMSQTDILFGGSAYPGSDGAATNATWSWNGTTWTQQSMASSPPARLGGQMITDDATGDVLLFGGTSVTGSFLSDTWTANAGSISLVLPWVHGAPGQPFYINGGNTYSCGDHTGRDAYAIDFDMASGTELAADAGGTVHEAVQKNAQGAYILYGMYMWIVSPGGFVSLYAHLSAYAVQNGATVSQGQLVAYSGNSGNSTGPHLHFAVRQNATTQADGTAYKPEPMEGADNKGNPKSYSGFGAYGACQHGAVGGPYYA